MTYTIERVESTKFLGVIINSSLIWNDMKVIHIKVIGILKYVRNKLSVADLRSFYFALINLYYEYANVVWGGGDAVVLRKLLLTQKMLFA